MTVVQDIVSSKVFLWHPKNQSNPKTRDSWLWTYGGQVVFDPAVIATQLSDANKLVSDAKKTNKNILIICEKEVYKEEVELFSEKHGVHYLNHKVPAGVLTNFDTLLSRIRSMRDMQSFIHSDAFGTLTKKEQQMKKRALNKIEKVYKWVVNMRSKPNLVIIVDGQFMHKFVDEVQKMKTQSIVLASSNFDLRLDSAVVMCNVNSRKSIDFVMNSLFS